MKSTGQELQAAQFSLAQEVKLELKLKRFWMFSAGSGPSCSNFKMADERVLNINPNTKAQGVQKYKK